MFKFQELLSYKLARGHYKDCTEFIASRKLHRALEDQLLRAHLSVVLNIAEGNARMTPKDQKRFYSMARASLAECVAIYDCLQIQAEISVKLYEDITNQLAKTSYILWRHIKS